MDFNLRLAEDGGPRDSYVVFAKNAFFCTIAKVPYVV